MGRYVLSAFRNSDTISFTIDCDRMEEKKQMNKDNECKYCNDLNEEKEAICITEIEIISLDLSCGYKCLIRHCPFCGTLLQRYQTRD